MSNSFGEFFGSLTSGRVGPFGTIYPSATGPFGSVTSGVVGPFGTTTSGFVGIPDAVTDGGASLISMQGSFLQEQSRELLKSASADQTSLSASLLTEVDLALNPMSGSTISTTTSAPGSVKTSIPSLASASASASASTSASASASSATRTASSTARLSDIGSSSNAGAGNVSPVGFGAAAVALVAGLLF